MSKPFSVDDGQVKHYVLPEITGDIVGYSKETVKPQTVEDIEALQKEAFEEGRKQGRKAGLDEIKREAQRLAGMLNFFQAPLAKLDEEVEQQLTELALMVARQVIKKECATDATIIQSIIHEALDFLPLNSRNIRVRLNPADLELLKQADFNIDEQEWKAVPDTTVRQGGCLIDSDNSHVDASLETRLQQIIDQLTEHRPHYQDED